MDVISPHTAKGFTLIELVIVISIIAIVSTMVMVKWSAPTVNVGAAAKQLASDIHYTQTLAMTRGKRYYLIKQSATTYQILNNAGSPVTLAFGNTTMTLNSGITFGTLTNLPSNLIAFDGTGTPYTTSSSPGTALATTATMPLVSGTTTFTVSISPTTGRVTVS